MSRTLVCALAALAITGAGTSLPGDTRDSARSVGTRVPAAPTTAALTTAAGTGSLTPAGFGWQ